MGAALAASVVATVTASPAVQRTALVAAAVALPWLWHAFVEWALQERLKAPFTAVAAAARSGKSISLSFSSWGEAREVPLSQEGRRNLEVLLTGKRILAGMLFQKLIAEVGETMFATAAATSSKALPSSSSSPSPSSLPPTPSTAEEDSGEEVAAPDESADEDPSLTADDDSFDLDELDRLLQSEGIDDGFVDEPQRDDASLDQPPFDESDAAGEVDGVPSLEEDQDIFGDSGLEAKATEEANADSLFDDESDLSDLFREQEDLSSSPLRENIDEEIDGVGADEEDASQLSREEDEDDNDNDDDDGSSQGGDISDEARTENSFLDGDGDEFDDYSRDVDDPSTEDSEQSMETDMAMQQEQQQDEEEEMLARP